MLKNNKNLIFTFGILAFVLAVSFASPVSAYYVYSVNGPAYMPDSPAYTYVSNPNPSTYIPVQNFNTTSSTNTTYSSSNSNNTDTNNVSNSKTTVKNSNTNTTNTNKTNTTSTQNINNNTNGNGSVNNNSNNTSNASDINENYKSLTSNALFGSNSFMPSGLAQWIFLAIIIAIIIFLWRYVHAKEKYMIEPLKHA